MEKNKSIDLKHFIYNIKNNKKYKINEDYLKELESIIKKMLAGKSNNKFIEGISFDFIFIDKKPNKNFIITTPTLPHKINLCFYIKEATFKENFPQIYIFFTDTNGKFILNSKEDNIINCGY
ncbi:MAG: hypothetical protein U0457_12280 [Candidatus Sericytochromatia bacterium]